MWLDHTGVQIIPAELKKYLQCEEFQENVIKFQLTSTADKSSLKVWNPLAKEAGRLVTWLFPQAYPQWRFPQFFPVGAVVYGEFPMGGQGDLLDYLRGFEEKLGPEALKEYERNLQEFEAKYGFEVREDLLDMFKQGCAVGLYNRESAPKSLGVPEIFMMVTKSNTNLIPMLKKNLVLQGFVIGSGESDNEVLFQVKNGRQTHVLYWESRALIYCNDIDFLRKCQTGVWAKKSPALMLPEELSNFGLGKSGYGNRIYMDSTIYKTFLLDQKFEHILAKIPWTAQHTPRQKNQVVEFLTDFNVWAFFNAEVVQNRIEAELILNHKIILPSPK